MTIESKEWKLLLDERIEKMTEKMSREELVNFCIELFSTYWLQQLEELREGDDLSAQKQSTNL